MASGDVIPRPAVGHRTAALLAPRSIAIVGLSADAAKHGGRVLANLRRLGYTGIVWGVNPRLPQVADVPVVATLPDLPAPPDLVVCAVPAPAVTEVVRGAGAAGAHAAIVFAGGFAERGAAGAEAQRQLADAARTAGVRVLGPNSGGVIRPGTHLAVSFLTCLERPAHQIRSGPVGVVTQSGGTGSYLHNLAAARDDGLAVSVSTGNEVDVDVADGIAALCGLEEVRAIAIVLEAVRDGDAFVAAIERAHASGRPVIACRIGASDHGRALMRSHTGAIAGAPRVLDGMLDALGVARVETPEELLDVAGILARAPVPAGDRVGVVTHSGGVGILLSDLGERDGVALPAPSRDLRADLAPLLDLGSAGNPLDMGGIIGGPSRFAEVVDAVAASGDYDAVLAVSTAHPPAHTPTRVRSLTGLATAVPVVHLWMAGDQAADGLRRLRTAGHPVTEEPRAAMRALAGLVGLARPAPPLDRPLGSRRTAPPGGPPIAWTEQAAKDLLTMWGLPVADGALVATPDEAAATAARLGGRVAVKISSPDIAHKTECGGVRLGITGSDGAAAAFGDVMAAARRAHPGARIDGVRVERQVVGPEVLVGAFHDDVFGAMLLIGPGGTAAEAAGGHVVVPAVDTPPHAARAVDRAAALRRALARHGDVTAALRALTGLLVTVGRRFAATSLHELEMNPVIWTGDGWRIADAYAAGSAAPAVGQRSPRVP